MKTKGLIVPFAVVLLSGLVLGACASGDETGFFHRYREVYGEQDRSAAARATQLDWRDYWDPAVVDTAREVEYLSETEKDIILEHNLVRTRPSLYAELYIAPRRRFYNGRRLLLPGRTVEIMTQEGVAALDEAVGVLSRTESREPVIPSRGLSLAARDHVRDQAGTGATGHDGSDGSSPYDRMERYGEWFSTAGENIAYGPSTGRDIVIDLLLDDGVPDRGHRTNILSPGFRRIGVAVASHGRFEMVSVMMYAGGFSD